MHLLKRMLDSQFYTKQGVYSVGGVETTTSLVVYTVFQTTGEQGLGRPHDLS